MAQRQQAQHTLSDDEIRRILNATAASSIRTVQTVQSLWSGYGHILRISVQGNPSAGRGNGPADSTSVILKRIQLPDAPEHPRGWHSEIATHRKIQSYRVEQRWYERYSQQCKPRCEVPALYDSYVFDQQVWLLMEDLDTAYPGRYQQLSVAQCAPALNWLARFHAYHLGNTGEGLWPVGTYWHLQTRPEEFDAMAEGRLKHSAEALNQRLHSCQHKTLLHGDAKIANICFSANRRQVAFVDFQYVGRGSGICDVIYFFSSCLDGPTCHQHADALLDNYFRTLRENLPEALGKSVELEWRSLYATAWADFHRFLAGWMPEHYKINSYVQSVTGQALSELSSAQ